MFSTGRKPAKGFDVLKWLIWKSEWELILHRRSASTKLWVFLYLGPGVNPLEAFGAAAFAVRRREEAEAEAARDDPALYVRCVHIDCSEIYSPLVLRRHILLYNIIDDLKREQAVLLRTFELVC